MCDAVNFPVSFKFHGFIKSLCPSCSKKSVFNALSAFSYSQRSDVNILYLLFQKISLLRLVLQLYIFTQRFRYGKCCARNSASYAKKSLKIHEVSTEKIAKNMSLIACKQVLEHDCAKLKKRRVSEIFPKILLFFKDGSD